MQMPFSITYISIVGAGSAKIALKLHWSLNLLARTIRLWPIMAECSVPARLGKGQGAKEIWHNLAREQPKFGHNLERDERNEVWAQFCGRSMKTWAQICKHFTSIFTPLSANTKTAITICKKKKIIFNSNRAGHSALRNMPSWNTGMYNSQLSTCMTDGGLIVALAMSYIHSTLHRVQYMFRVLAPTYKSDNIFSCHTRRFRGVGGGWKKT